MPILRVNAVGPEIEARSAAAQDAVASDKHGAGPVIAMLHGYKYMPGHPEHCPHRQILALRPRTTCKRSQSWPRRLGFGTGCTDEGLAVAFGWNARGAVWSAQAKARAAGRVLARLLERIHRDRPDRPIHMIAHSMGCEVALAALEQLPAGSVGRIVSMTGACYRTRTLAALDSPAGREAEFVNIVSRENDVFDFLFERLIAPPASGDRSIGHGLPAGNAVTLQIDCPETLAHLDRIGSPVAPPEARICHWSSYTRPGIMRFYNALLRAPAALPLSLLQQGVPRRPALRWSRLVPRPALHLRPVRVQPQVS